MIKTYMILTGKLNVDTGHLFELCTNNIYYWIGLQKSSVWIAKIRSIMHPNLQSNSRFWNGFQIHVQCTKEGIQSGFCNPAITILMITTSSNNTVFRLHIAPRAAVVLPK